MWIKESQLIDQLRFGQATFLSAPAEADLKLTAQAKEKQLTNFISTICILNLNVELKNDLNLLM